MLAAAAALWSPAAARAQGDLPVAYVFVISGATLEDLLDVPELRVLAGVGGASLVTTRTTVGEEVSRAFCPDPRMDVPCGGPDDLRIWFDGSKAGPDGHADRQALAAFADLLAQDVMGHNFGRTLVIVASDAPPPASSARGDQLGGVILAQGPGLNLARLLSEDRERPPGTLTSGSTRRDGVVAPVDVPATVAAFLGVPYEGIGTPIRRVAVPPPLDLHAKYVQYRELSAPIQTGVGVWELGIGALALTALRVRRRALVRVSLGATLSVPVLFLALLLVGHLPTISYATVVPVLVASTAIPGIALLRMVERRGIGAALAWSGGIGLGGLVLESLLGWNAALAPMLGGSHLDGARFFGMPNVEIGLALGGATLVAARIRSTIAGAGLIAAAGLWFGSPWFGSNLGASVTLFAGAGLWLGIRGKRGWRRTGVATVACATFGAALVVFAHRFLTDAPTHITRFAESSGGITGILEKTIDRLEIGVRLVADQPPALIPVVGTLVALVVVLSRPPGALRAGFALEPDARSAALTILLGSVVAYLANDTGAAALGLGFGTAMVTLFAVSLAAAREKMVT